MSQLLWNWVCSLDLYSKSVELDKERGRKKDEEEEGWRKEKPLSYIDRFGGGKARWREGIEEELVKQSLISVWLMRKKERNHNVCVCVCVCVCVRGHPTGLHPGLSNPRLK